VEKKELIFGKASPTTSIEEELEHSNDDSDDLMQLVVEAQNTASAAAGGKLSAEISHYLDHKSSLKPLHFWRKHQNDYPLLSSMARVFLCISAGSVPVESLFSSTGNILNSKRCSLAPSRCNMISFIHDNIEFV
jgi:hypothetical protein